MLLAASEMSRIKLIAISIVAMALLFGGWHFARVHDEAS